MNRPVDPISLARFLVMAGAAELIEAFSAIPEGPLRQSTVMHVQAIAQTYQNPPAHGAPDPLQQIAPDPVAALTGPRRGTPRTDDPSVRAVQLMLDGAPPAEAARQAGISHQTVLAAKKAAKSAGVIFPDLKTSKKPKGMIAFPVSLDGLGAAAYARVSQAAEERRISPETYMARRKLALEMAQAGRPIRAIIAATRESKKTLSIWFMKARSAGYDVPHMVDSAPAELEPVESELTIPAKPEPTAEIVDLQARRKADGSAFPLHETELDTAIRRVAIEQAAALMKLTVQQFLAKRRQAVEMFCEGKGPGYVSRTIGITLTQAQNWRQRAINAGRLRPKGGAKPNASSKPVEPALPAWDASFATPEAEIKSSTLTL